MSDHCQLSIKNPVLQAAPADKSDIQRMKFFTTDDISKFVCKQWGIQNSKKYGLKLRLCPSYQALIQHTQSKFKFIQILSQQEYFKTIDENTFISELAVESEITENDAKVIQLFYQISKEDLDSSSEEISSEDEDSTMNSVKSGTNTQRKEIVDVIINILQILTLK